MSGQEARRLSLGKVVIAGEDLSFHEQASTFRVASGETVELMVLYDYRETSHDKEHVRVELSATMAGLQLGRDAHEIFDNPMIADDARGFLAVPVRVSGGGAHKGRWKLRARYARGAWTGNAEMEEWILEREGDFTIEIEGSKSHRV